MNCTSIALPLMAVIAILLGIVIATLSAYLANRWRWGPFSCGATAAVIALVVISWVEPYFDWKTFWWGYFVSAAFWYMLIIETVTYAIMRIVIELTLYGSFNRVTRKYAHRT